VRHLLQQLLWVADVFDHVGGEDDVEVAAHIVGQSAFEVGLHEVVHAVAHARFLGEVDAGDVVALGDERLGEPTRTAADVEHAHGRSGLHELQHAPM
jgi:hypothetical protein